MCCGSKPDSYVRKSENKIIVTEKKKIKEFQKAVLSN